MKGQYVKGTNIKITRINKQKAGKMSTQDFRIFLVNYCKSRTTAWKHAMVRMFETCSNKADVVVFAVRGRV